MKNDKRTFTVAGRSQVGVKLEKGGRQLLNLKQRFLASEQKRLGGGLLVINW